jgi:hypothetical protein
MIQYSLCQDWDRWVGSDNRLIGLIDTVMPALTDKIVQLGGLFQIFWL